MLKVSGFVPIKLMYFFVLLQKTLPSLVNFAFALEYKYSSDSN